MGEEADADWQAGMIEAGAEATCLHQWTGWKIIGRTGDWFHPHIVQRRCKLCSKIEQEDQ